MPDVLANRKIIPEFIRQNARLAAIARGILSLRNDGARCDTIIAEFDAVIAKLGEDGTDDRAGRAILRAPAPAPIA